MCMEERSSSFRHHGRRSWSPSLRGSWRLGDSSLPLLIFHRSPLPRSLPPSLHPPDILFPPMSHDDTDTHYLQPYSPTSSPTIRPTNNNRGNNDGPFDPGNTPPLVFAFIAVGFIIFGLIIAVIYKKCHPLPMSHHQRSSVPIRRPSVRKPKLWDIRISPNRGVPDDERTNVDSNDWDSFMVSPFSSAPVSFRRSVS